MGWRRWSRRGCPVLTLAVSLVSGVHWIGSYYVQPGTVKDFNKIVNAVNSQEAVGVSPIIVLAGEQAQSAKEAEQKVDDYIALAQQSNVLWRDSHLERQLAVKLSAFDKDFGEEDHRQTVVDYVTRIAEACKSAGLGLVIDKESSIKTAKPRSDIFHRVQGQPSLAWAGMASASSCRPISPTAAGF